VFQLAMVMSQERVVMSYSVVVIAKLGLILLASKYTLCKLVFLTHRCKVILSGPGGRVVYKASVLAVWLLGSSLASLPF
jgi:hypothetical protein